MPVDFSNEEAIFLYGFFAKKIKKLEESKTLPGNPIADESINSEIALFSSIRQKIKNAHPNVKFLDDFLI